MSDQKPDLSPYNGMAGLERYYGESFGSAAHQLAAVNAQRHQQQRINALCSQLGNIRSPLASVSQSAPEPPPNPFAPRPSRIPPPPDETFMKEMRREWEGKR